MLTKPTLTPHEIRASNVADRRSYGETFRATITTLLPATCQQIVKSTGRSRASVMHHLNIMLEEKLVRCDKAYYPHVWRSK